MPGHNTIERTKIKVKYLQGAFWQNRSVEPSLDTMPLTPPTFNISNPFCGSTLTDPPWTISLSGECPTKLKGIPSYPEMMPFLYLQSDTILQGPDVPLMASTSCPGPRLNLQPPNERTAGTLASSPSDLLIERSC